MYWQVFLGKKIKLQISEWSIEENAKKIGK